MYEWRYNSDKEMHHLYYDGERVGYFEHDVDSSVPVHHWSWMQCSGVRLGPQGVVKVAAKGKVLNKG